MDAAALDELLGGSARARAESWRYSKNAIRALTQQAFVPASGDVPLADETLQRIDLPFTRGRRIVVVNGVYSQRYSDISKVNTGTRIASGSALTIDVTSGAGDLLHLAYVSVPADSASRWKASNEIRLQGGCAKLIEQYVGEDGAEVFGRLQSRITVDRQAQLRATIFSDLPDSVSLLRQESTSLRDSSVYNVVQAHFGGRLQRCEATIELAGTAAICSARGVFVLRGRQHVDVHLDVRHNARDTLSDVSWRGVADQRARGILHGSITVAPGADGADARLQTKNLLLSSSAEIDAQPVLEIYADDVKAAHGATVGQLDDTAMFYLRSRGVPAALARSLLIAGFCREALADIAHAELRGRLDALLVERLPAAAEEFA